MVEVDLLCCARMGLMTGIVEEERDGSCCIPDEIPVIEAVEEGHEGVCMRAISAQSSIVFRAERPHHESREQDHL